MRTKLAAGQLEDSLVTLNIEAKNAPVQILGAVGMEQMEMDLQNMLEKFSPKQSQSRQVTIKEARKILLEQEAEALIEPRLKELPDDVFAPTTEPTAPGPRGR